MHTYAQKVINFGGKTRKNKNPVHIVVFTDAAVSL